MDEKDKKRFGQLLVVVAEVFDKDFSRPVMDMYFIALKQFPIYQVERALEKVVLSCKFFPRPAEIVEFISGCSGKIEDVAHAQADAVINAIRKKGSYKSVKFKDQITTTVIQNTFSGWIKMCSESLELNEKWIRKDFVEAYKRYAALGVKSDHHFAGLIEAENGLRGYLDHIPEPEEIEGVEVMPIPIEKLN